jgi:hypothetical protein
VLVLVNGNNPSFSFCFESSLCLENSFSLCPCEIRFEKFVFDQGSFSIKGRKVEGGKWRGESGGGK